MPNENRDAVILAMLDNPEQADQIAEASLDGSLDDLIGTDEEMEVEDGEAPEGEPQDVGNTDKAKANAVREMLLLHAQLWDFPTDQIPSEEEILAHMNGQDNQT